MFTYITWTLLKFPNSAGTDPIRWFLLKFLHEQLWKSGNNAHRKDNKNSERLVLNIQFKNVKGVNAQDSRTASMKFIAPVGNGVGVVAQLPNVEGGEIRKEEGD